MSAKYGKTTDREILDDVAQRLIERYTICAYQLVTDFQGHIVPANEGWGGRVEQLALAETKKMSAELLGRLIYAEPDADLYGVHCGTWLGKYESGPYLLQQIAATAIVCRIRAKLGVTSGVTEHAPHQKGLNRGLMPTA